MAAARTASERNRAPHGGDARRRDGVPVVRRPPFSDNPEVGARGQRTQQRILDAALRVFGERGYHRASIDRIARIGGCSRVSFYQYFASKEDVFGHLATQVARQVGALTASLDQLTPDRRGWANLRGWVSRYTETHARYEPVFHAYETDEMLAGIAARTGAEVVSGINSRLVTSTIPPRQLEPVIRLLLESLNHTLGVVGVLRSVTPRAYPAERLDDVITDVLHRTLFGLINDANVHPAGDSPPPKLEIGADLRSWLEGDDVLERVGSDNRASSALLDAGREVFARRGYHNTRVDDIVTAAGVSHGAFYRYFRNKDQLARMLTARALQVGGAALLDLPDVSTLDEAGRTGIRTWLRRYNAAEVEEAAMLRVWVEAALQDPVLRAESAPPLDWGRRRLSRYLRPRGFGDPDLDAVVMVGLLGVFGVRPRAAKEVDAAAHVIERGLLGR
jgi:AcrR family transcriptional regulator